MVNGLKNEGFLNTFLKGSVIMVSGNFFIKILIVLTTIVVLRFVSVFDYGLWQLVLSIVGFFTILVLPGIEELLINDASKEFGSNKPDEGKEILKHSSVVIILLGAASGIALYIFAPYVTFITKVDLVDMLRIVAWYFPLYAIQRVYSLTFYSYQKFFLAQVTTALSRLSYLLVVLVGIFVWQVGVLSLAYAYVLSIFVSLFLLLPWFLPAIISIFKTDRTSSEDSFSFIKMLREHGKWTLVSDYFNNLISSVRPWIIGYFLGVEWVAILAVATALLGEVSTIFPLSTILNPIIPRHAEDKKKFQRIFHKGTVYSVWLYSALALVGFISAPYVIPILFPQYIFSILYFQIMLISLPFTAVVAIVSRIFFVMKNQKTLFFSGVAPRLLGTLIILPIFSSLIGPVGVAVEKVITSIVLTKFKLSALIKSGAVPSFLWNDFFKFKKEDRDFIRRIINFGSK